MTEAHAKLPLFPDIPDIWFTENSIPKLHLDTWLSINPK